MRRYGAFVAGSDPQGDHRRKKSRQVRTRNDAPALLAAYKQLRHERPGAHRATLLLQLPEGARELLTRDELDAADVEVLGDVAQLDSSIVEHIYARSETLVWSLYDLAGTFSHALLKGSRRGSANAVRRRAARTLGFRYHAKRLIAENDLKRKRNGQRLHQMYDAARIGRATDPTGGAIEILDVDGFQAKVFIRHPNGRRKTPFQIWVIFAVSRLSSAVVGYSLSLKRENARAYKECLASVHIPKCGEGSRAAELGLGELRGLVHGNYDEIYVDHGPGSSESVLGAIVDRLRLARSIPPPRRPELRAIGESLNNLILRFYQNADAGYSRARDPLSQEKRRAAKKAAPVSVEQFERLLLLSINHINLYYAKRRKLTDELRRKGINSTPARLFKAYQVAREGDRKRKLSPLEVWEKYSDWEKYSCRRGNMTRDDLRRRSFGGDVCGHGDCLADEHVRERSRAQRSHQRQAHRIRPYASL